LEPNIELNQWNQLKTLKELSNRSTFV